MTAIEMIQYCWDTDHAVSSAEPKSQEILKVTLQKLALAFTMTSEELTFQKYFELVDS